MSNKIQFLGGTDSSFNSPRFHVIDNSDEFKIAPVKTSAGELLFAFIFFSLLGFVASYFIYQHTSDFLKSSIPAVVMLITAIALVLLSLKQSKVEQSKGDFIVHYKEDDTIYLPRKNIRLARKEITLETVSGWYVFMQDKTKFLELHIIDETTNDRLFVLRSTSVFLRSLRKIITYAKNNNIKIYHRDIETTECS